MAEPLLSAHLTRELGDQPEVKLQKGCTKPRFHHGPGMSLDELPDDIEDEKKYIRLPNKHQLDLGKPLVFAFIRRFLPDDYDEVRAIFSRRGAYARFKDLLHRKGALQQWHDFESKAEEEALRDWCNLKSIELTD